MVGLQSDLAQEASHRVRDLALVDARIRRRLDDILRDVSEKMSAILWSALPGLASIVPPGTVLPVEMGFATIGSPDPDEPPLPFEDDQHAELRLDTELYY